MIRLQIRCRSTLRCVCKRKMLFIPRELFLDFALLHNTVRLDVICYKRGHTYSFVSNFMAGLSRQFCWRHGPFFPNGVCIKHLFLFFIDYSFRVAAFRMSGKRCESPTRFRSVSLGPPYRPRLLTTRKTIACRLSNSAEMIFEDAKYFCRRDSPLPVSQFHKCAAYFLFFRFH